MKWYWYNDQSEENSKDDRGNELAIHVFSNSKNSKLVPLLFDSQPFESRRRWFYDNLDREGSNREIIHSPPDENDVLVINRGKTSPELLVVDCIMLLDSHLTRNFPAYLRVD